MKKQTGRRNGTILYIARCVLLDFILFAAILLVFAYFHHVRPQEETGLGVVSARGTLPPETARPTSIPTARPEATPEPVTPGELSVSPEPTQTPAPARVGDFTGLYPDQFTSGEVIAESTEDAVIYKSGNVSIRGTVGQIGKSKYYLADIYIQDIENLQCGFSDGKYGKGQRQMPEGIARDAGAILAINGDYYSIRTEGTVLRNGVLYRDSAFRDICVLYWNGVMKTYSASEMSATQAIADGAYQIWSFGPALLNDQGQPAEHFITNVAAENPRTVIGYYAPGHYCFLVVEGRNKASEGVTIWELAAFMSELGCKSAYNLDGGQTSTMVYQNQVLNYRYGGGRQCSDIVMIVE